MKMEKTNILRCLLEDDRKGMGIRSQDLAVRAGIDRPGISREERRRAKRRFTRHMRELKRGGAVTMWREADPEITGFYAFSSVFYGLTDRGREIAEMEEKYFGKEVL